MRLTVSEQAPDVTLLNQQGDPIELANLWANGPTVLTFLRHFG